MHIPHILTTIFASAAAVKAGSSITIKDVQDYLDFEHVKGDVDEFCAWRDGIKGPLLEERIVAVKNANKHLHKLCTLRSGAESDLIQGFPAEASTVTETLTVTAEPTATITSIVARVETTISTPTSQPTNLGSRIFGFERAGRWFDTIPTTSKLEDDSIDPKTSLSEMMNKAVAEQMAAIEAELAALSDSESTTNTKTQLERVLASWFGSKGEDDTGADEGALTNSDAATTNPQPNEATAQAKRIDDAHAWDDHETTTEDLEGDTVDLKTLLSEAVDEAISKQLDTITMELTALRETVDSDNFKRAAVVHTGGKVRTPVPDEAEKDKYKQPVPHTSRNMQGWIFASFFVFSNLMMFMRRGDDHLPLAFIATTLLLIVFVAKNV